MKSICRSSWTQASAVRRRLARRWRWARQPSWPTPRLPPQAIFRRWLRRSSRRLRQAARHTLPVWAVSVKTAWSASSPLTGFLAGLRVRGYNARFARKQTRYLSMENENRRSSSGGYISEQNRPHGLSARHGADRLRAVQRARSLRPWTPMIAHGLYRRADVLRRAGRRTRSRPEDFGALLSPAAAAVSRGNGGRVHRRETRQLFRRLTVYLFTPIYIVELLRELLHLLRFQLP